MYVFTLSICEQQRVSSRINAATRNLWLNWTIAWQTTFTENWYLRLQPVFVIYLYYFFTQMYVILFQNLSLSCYDQLIMFIEIPEWDIPAADPMNYENDIQYTINYNIQLQLYNIQLAILQTLTRVYRCEEWEILISTPSRKLLQLLYYKNYLLNYKNVFQF